MALPMATFVKLHPLATAAAASVGGAALLGTQYFGFRTNGFPIALDQQRDITSIDNARPNQDERQLTASSFPKGYFVKMREELPDPTLEHLKKLATKNTAELTERERIYLRRARELNLLNPKEESSAEGKEGKK